MSSFFLVRKDKKSNTDAVQTLFKEQGFSKIRQFDLNDYELLFCEKILVETPFFIEENDCSLFVSGTMLYKQGKDMTTSLQLLFDDLKDNTVDETQLLGMFCILFYKADKITLLIDASGVQNVYYDSDQSVLSSSFLAVAYVTKNNLTINKQAALETICTGLLIGSETLFNEIKRVEKENVPHFDSIQITYLARHDHSRPKPENFDRAIEEQNNRLENYFSRVKPFADKVGVDSGLTGGYDSRLLYSLIKKSWSNFSIHSYYRKTKTRELIIAETLASKTNTDLHVTEVTHPLDMNEDQFLHTMNESYLFYDGHIRMHSYWTEEYNTREHRTRVLGDKRIGVSGIGGEQYRNMEGLYLRKWSLDSYVKYDMLLFSCGNIFQSEKSLQDTCKNIRTKISKKLGTSSTETMNLRTLKRYLAEIFIPAKLGARNNAENKISYFISPYIDPYISDYAYRCVPYLGVSNSFQAKMISQLSFEIASVTSDYGYDFNQGEPVKQKLRKLVSDLIPKRILLSMLEKHPKMNNIQAWNTLTTKHPVCLSYYETVKSLDLPIDLNKLVKRVDLMPLVIELGFLLQKIGYNKQN